MRMVIARCGAKRGTMHPRLAQVQGSNGSHCVLRHAPRNAALFCGGKLVVETSFVQNRKSSTQPTFRAHRFESQIRLALFDSQCNSPRLTTHCSGRGAVPRAGDSVANSNGILTWERSDRKS